MVLGLALNNSDLYFRQESKLEWGCELQETVPHQQHSNLSVKTGFIMRTSLAPRKGMVGERRGREELPLLFPTHNFTTHNLIQ